MPCMNCEEFKCGGARRLRGEREELRHENKALQEEIEELEKTLRRVRGGRDDAVTEEKSLRAAIAAGRPQSQRTGPKKTHRGTRSAKKAD